ncbi:Hypothetical predicted protein [Mytilus galloprovincialis]|uniref:Reverse transcriptase domain-containing protein n=1 Tax=Mytilus galloprovincialis TaxID=29158 RepID=A0A8B6FZR3_MYTGA|nr:Hypothetical predicted protein [Mytilus galloprovincialis]
MNEELPIPLTRKIASPVTSANQIVQQIHKEVIEQLPDTNNNRTLSLNYGQELSKFLMKKDLIISRLLKYDDRPENYLSWKDTFKCVMSEIDASPAEEIDLMIKWLGPDSSRQINSIKISNSGNPTIALSRAWNRLVLRYGCPEMIESALQKKLQAFPKITYKDKKKLFELSDVLSEIRSVKEKQEYAALLAYFDTSVGVNPTIVKLPINLQNKWRDRAVTYKRIHSVLYPPFTYFCDFINDMASTINDPGFIFESDTYVAPKNEDKPFKTRQFAVKKTNVSQDKHEPHANENSKMRCAIHNSDHLLDECRAFRHMSIVDRRALLKKNGETCLDGAHYPSTVNAMKTFVQQDGRPSILEPCDNSIHISEKLSTSLFKLEPDDNRQGMSIEDKKFMRLMSDEIQQDENQNWTAPLPFKESRPLLPNNRLQALNRARAFDISLRKDPVKKQHVLDFMKTLFDNNHAERALNTETPNEMWYLPMFGVYHPKKKDRIRVVFDSSAKFQGTSLNDVLMTGPNLVNSLLGVLLRFRKDKIAITADIRQMFYSFNVTPEHRDFLRFIWHEDNDMEKDLVDYRMAVHVFGNSPSPAVATFGLRKTAEMAESKYGSDVVTYVNNNFYVDDALSSHSNSDKAVDLLKRTQSALQEFGNLRLHKISSNSNEVLAAFEKDDLSEDLKNLDFSDDCLPVQRSLGVSWNLQSDNFTFQVSLDNKPYTRRGVLSVINGLYDPLGFAAPVTIAGKLILRETMKESTEWDEPLPPQFQSKWQSWKDSLKLLQQVEIPRNYSSDWTLNKDLFLAVELYETICEELKTEFQQVQFFTDSKVVLGYIHNETKRFYLYVGNRVDRIRRSTKPEQWSYVPTLQNPADDASRSIRPEKLNQSQWLIGPTQFLCKKNTIDSETEGDEFPLILPEEDREVRVAKTLVTKLAIGSKRFERFFSVENTSFSNTNSQMFYYKAN